MNLIALKHILEAAMLAHAAPLSLDRMLTLFDEHEQPPRRQLEAALVELGKDLQGRGIELVKVASGYRLQARSVVMPWISRLWDEKPQRYSRALLETMAIIAYRQPVTRGDIEDIRGVAVTTNIIRTLIERDWIKVVGHRDVPGRPALFATTSGFLDYFGLQQLDQLPTLAEIRELDDANRRLVLGDEAEARHAPDEDYDFVSDDDVARRGADVLAATEKDLATAAELVERVENNLFGSRDDSDRQSSGSGEKNFSDLIRRLQRPQDQSSITPDSPAPEAPAVDDRKEDSDL